jgi:cytochrome c biogenesis protein CcmG/thiol:disulfide interchange protein DsbE
VLRKQSIVLALAVWALSMLLSLSFADERKAPDFRLKKVDGDDIQFADMLNRGPILVDFWATWCVPCLKEMGQFQKLYEKYHDRGFEILAISIDTPRSASKIKPTVKSKGFTFPILLDPNTEVLRMYGGRSVVPYAVIVSPDGHIVTTYEGYKSGNEKVVEQEIQKYLIDAQSDSSSPEGGTD